MSICDGRWSWDALEIRIQRSLRERSSIFVTGGVPTTHAARKVVSCVAELLDWEFQRVGRQAGIPLSLNSGIKRALDSDWSDPHQKATAVDTLAKQVLSLERWIEQKLQEEAGQPPLDQLLGVLRKLVEQDLEPDPEVQERTY